MNHVIKNEVMRKEWEKRFCCLYYDFLFHNTLFIVMDNNNDPQYNLSEKQTSFVLKILSKYKNVRWAYLFVHHPIWKYNTDGRFAEIEKALNGRRFTVFAGHEHQYHYYERNGADYYILSTSGGGNPLRGNYMGEFDHIFWVTSTDHGPIIANLRLDGILPHNISNDLTSSMAVPMLENAALKGILLSKQEDHFKHGTYYLYFLNPTAFKLKININFLYDSQLILNNSVIDTIVGPGSTNIFEIPIHSATPIAMDRLNHCVLPGN